MIQTLEREQQLEKAAARPLVLFFKHSTRCPVSAAAFDEIQRLETLCPALEIWMVPVIENRPLSLYLARKLGIRHESPQALLLQESRLLWHASHFQITAKAVLDHLPEQEPA